MHDQILTVSETFNWHNPMAVQNLVLNYIQVVLLVLILRFRETGK